MQIDVVIQWLSVITCTAGHQASGCLGLHPLVCSLIVESHPFHKIVCFVWTTAMDTTKPKKGTIMIPVRDSDSDIIHSFLSHKTKFTFHICKEWVVSSGSLFGGGGV